MNHFKVWSINKINKTHIGCTGPICLMIIMYPFTTVSGMINLLACSIIAPVERR